MSWNNRVIINEHTYIDGEKESTATMHEVHYTADGVMFSGVLFPQGSGTDSTEALQALKLELQMMLEAVEFVLDGKTSIFDYDNKDTHDAGEHSEIIRKRNEVKVLDRDDAYLDEKYGDE
ncbi:hypothetical protein [Yersinia phage fHe-Yen9-03]|uniref:Uncharacterized protein n=1 Tax=Yersinia phage fHe-Yen9-03 TaxID=2052743 RepID=A0A2C9CZD4_9CAUD|nr:hypothetical protein [Yersinia phage fHe-Yen9-03]